MKSYLPILKKPLLVISILLAGFLPVLIYFVWYGGLGVSEIGKLQSVNSSEKFALMLSLFNIKPIYMFFGILLLITLFERTPSPARSLFWGMIAFITGELICGAIFVSFRRELIISEHIHSYGIILEFTFITFAFVEWMEQRVSPKNSRIRFLFWIALFGICASFSLLSVSTSTSGYYADLFGFHYTYIRYEFNQWIESRFLPIASLCFFLLTLFTILKSKHAISKIFFSAGIGLLAFSTLRLTLGSLFTEHLVWFEFWEEATQFILITTILFLFWKYKREWMLERIALFR